MVMPSASPGSERRLLRLDRLSVPRFLAIDRSRPSIRMKTKIVMARPKVLFNVRSNADFLKGSRWGVLDPAEVGVRTRVRGRRSERVDDPWWVRT